MRKIYSLLMVCSFVTAIKAQDSLATKTLQEVVISASRMEQSIIETPRSVTVISRDVIEKEAYNSVGDLLSSQQGLYIAGANQTPGTNQSLFLRGANSNQVVVMIDGVRITDPSSPNAAIDLSELSLTNVERVEIIRGSHSTVYGGSAIGGVINIITKSNQTPGLHGNVGLQAGTYGNGSSAFTETADLYYALQSGLYFNGSVLNQNVNGLNASVKSPFPGFSTADKDGFQKTDGFLKAGYHSKAWQAFVSFKRSTQTADIDNGAFTDDDNNYVEFNRILLEYKLGHTFNDRWNALILGSWSASNRINENDSSIVDESGATDRSYFKGDYEGKLLTQEVQVNYQHEGLRALLGSGVYHEDMSFNTFYFSNAFGFPYTSITNYDTLDTSARSFYVFGQANYSAGNFNVTAGARLTNHSRFGNYSTFEISPSYRLKSSLLYLSVSSGYASPSLYQLYDPSKGFDAYTTRGNKKLKPEESLSFEAGVKKEFETGSYMTLSAFHTRVKNSIEYVYLWNNEKAISDLDYSDYRGDTYLNIARQNVNGIEVDGRAYFGKRFSIEGNVTWLTGKVKASPDDLNEAQTGPNHVQLYSYGSFLNEDVERDDLVRRPKVTAYSRLTFKVLPNLSIYSIYRLAGSRFDSGYDPNAGPFGALRQIEVRTYTLLDFGVNWVISKNFSVNGKIENLLNENYSEIVGFQTRGRSGYIRLLFQW